MAVVPRGFRKLVLGLDDLRGLAVATQGTVAAPAAAHLHLFRRPNSLREIMRGACVAGGLPRELGLSRRVRRRLDDEVRLFVGEGPQPSGATPQTLELREGDFEQGRERPVEHNALVADIRVAASGAGLRRA